MPCPECYPLQAYCHNANFPLCVVTIPDGHHSERMFHGHDSSELVIVTTGRGRHILAGESTSIASGDVLLIHPGVTHGYDNCKTMGLVNILYDSRHLPFPVLDGETMPLFRHFFPRGRRFFHCTSVPLLHLDEESLQVVISRIRALSDELLSARPGTQLASIALFMEILVRLSRNTPAAAHRKADGPTRIAQAIELLNEHFASEINLDEVARKACLSRRNFDRQFNRITGQTPLNYIVQRRILFAVTLLQTTNYNINQIAEQCGFNSANYFCRKFRKIMNVSPRTYRQQFVPLSASYSINPQKTVDFFH